MSAQVTAIRPTTTAADNPTVWLSPDQVCERVPGMTKRRLEEMRAAGRGPRYFKPTGKTVIYEQADIDAWVRATVVTTRDSA